MSAPSKNQRSGPKQKQRVFLCARGHPLVHTLFVGEGFKWACDCNYPEAYKPSPNDPPPGQWLTRKAKYRAGGKARIWFEYPETPQKP